VDGAVVVVPPEVPPAEAGDASWFALHPARKSIPQEQSMKQRKRLARDMIFNPFSKHMQRSH